MLLAFLLAQDPAALVERLRSDDIEIRDRAEADLVRLGPAAEAALDAASKDADPEIASRARRLLVDVIAPHRKQLLLEVRHVGRHLATAMDGPPAGISPLISILWKLDPRHPLLKDPTTARLERIDLDLTYASRERWMHYREQVTEAFDKTAYDRTCGICVGRRLRSCRLGLTFENAKLDDILAYLRDVGGVTLILDAMVSDEAKQLDLDRAVTIEMKDVTLAEALARLLRPYGMGFQVVGQEGVVLIGTRVKSAE